MTKRAPTLWTALVALLVLAAAPLAAQQTEYAVTIYNLTKAQPISPPLVVSHHDDVALFQVGQAASEPLFILAEDGDPAPLAELLSTISDVGEVAVADGPIPPGGSVTLMLGADFPFHRISAIGMLVNTNDAFFALDTATAPRGRFQSESFYAVAYDAGSEENNEDCDFIPGPACGGAGAGVRAPGGAEGYVYVHPGIHGIADLAPSAYDWRNPVVKILIQRVR